MKILTRQEELIILTIYRMSGQASLIEVRDFLIENTKKTWQVSTCHAILDRMEKSGFLKSIVGEPSAKRGGRAVKYYKLTKLAMDALEEVQSINATMWQGIQIQSNKA